MQEREPHASDLLVTGSARIDDAAADVQVRLRIAVIENIIAVDEPCSRKADRHQRQRGNNRQFKRSYSRFRTW